MKRSTSEPIRLLWRQRTLATAFGLLLAATASAAQAQATSTSSQHLPAPSDPTSLGEDGDSFHNREWQERLQRTREKERQRRMVDDANRLVELTALYRKSLQEHGTATPDDQKLLAQIEKLAREVKDRMRGM